MIRLEADRGSCDVVVVALVCVVVALFALPLKPEFAGLPHFTF